MIYGNNGLWLRPCGFKFLRKVRGAIESRLQGPQSIGMRLQRCSELEIVTG
jgi:hypothetical protein